MGEPVTRDAIDTLAADLFSRDHPDRAWSAIVDHRNRLGVASALEQAVYRGFATAKLRAQERALPEPAIAAAALAAETASTGKLRP